MYGSSFFVVKHKFSINLILGKSSSLDSFPKTKMAVSIFAKKYGKSEQKEKNEGEFGRFKV